MDSTEIEKPVIVTTASVVEGLAATEKPVLETAEPKDEPAVNQEPVLPNDNDKAPPAKAEDAIEN